MEITSKNGSILILISVIIVCIGIYLTIIEIISLTSLNIIFFITGEVILLGNGFIAYDKYCKNKSYKLKIKLYFTMVFVMIIFMIYSVIVILI